VVHAGVTALLVLGEIMLGRSLQLARTDAMGLPMTGVIDLLTAAAAEHHGAARRINRFSM
jgi:hypothetical protein